MIDVDPLPLEDPDAPMWAQELANKQNDLQATLAGILDTVSRMHDQVTPMIEKISNHPMLKMMGLNK